MSISIEEAGILPQLRLVRESAVGVVGPELALIEPDVQVYINGWIGKAVDTAIEQTLRVIDEVGFVTTVVEGGVGDIVDQTMGSQWADAINS